MKKKEERVRIEGERERVTKGLSKEVRREGGRVRETGMEGN